MKNFITTFLLFLISILVFAKETEEKTFLVLFDRAELKEYKTSPNYIELSLTNIFKTKSYSGNSDAAIIVKVPYSNIDECQLGYIFVRVNNKTILPLQDIALKIIDLDYSKTTYDQLLTSFEDKAQKNKKNNKTVKTIPSL
ncbi:hypothetical protein [Shivajiella indica]|uniref:Uncharacterized protein n=1 Tax=Shivajiella indica TaxID=872115 RepID=A0ABW5BCE2_9BACT